MSTCSDMIPIDESIAKSFEIVKTAFESNDVDLVIGQLAPLADKSLYHAAMNAMFEMLKAGLTMNADDMAKAKKATRLSLKQCKKLRKKQFKKLTDALTKKTADELYTDLEMHAELTFAIVTGCKSILALLNCTNMKKLAKIAYQIGVAVNTIA